MLGNRIIYFLFLALLMGCNSGSTTTTSAQDESADTVSFNDTVKTNGALPPGQKEALDRILDEKMRIDVSDTNRQSP